MLAIVDTRHVSNKNLVFLSRRLCPLREMRLEYPVMAVLLARDNEGRLYAETGYGIEGSQHIQIG